jgi:8-oxo-dGTP pyrophosphatase MutT (NUDIX family)
MTGFQRHIDACNRHDLARYRPFMIAGQQMGWVFRAHADLLAAKAGKNFILRSDALHLADHLRDVDARTKALAEATELLRTQRQPAPKLRDELYPVTSEFDLPPLALLDRLAVPWFGIRAWGIHLNGYVRKKDGLHIWLGERAHDRGIEPGKLDQIVAGGQPYSLTLAENLRKEADEEAGMPAALADRAVAAGTISYTFGLPDALRQDTLFVYDLELPEDFVPKNQDGEVHAFHLLPAAEVVALIRDTDKFKMNVNLVLIDFLERSLMI